MLFLALKLVHRCYPVHVSPFQGDLRSYLSQQDWMFRNAELLQLQKMACEIAAGVTHLHKHNFLHR